MLFTLNSLNTPSVVVKGFYHFNLFIYIYIIFLTKLQAFQMHYPCMSYYFILNTALQHPEKCRGKKKVYFLTFLNPQIFLCFYSCSDDKYLALEERHNSITVPQRWYVTLYVHKEQHSLFCNKGNFTLLIIFKQDLHVSKIFIKN